MYTYICIDIYIYICIYIYIYIYIYICHHLVTIPTNGHIYFEEKRKKERDRQREIGRLSGWAEGQRERGTEGERNKERERERETNTALLSPKRYTSIFAKKSQKRRFPF